MKLDFEWGLSNVLKRIFRDVRCDSIIIKYSKADLAIV